MAEQKNPQAQPELSLSEQTRIRREKLTNLQAEGQNPFVITRFDWDATSQQIKDNFDAMEGKPVKVAGRLMSKRGMGKVSFCDLQDKSGRIQIYARKDEMDEDAYDRFRKYDIGDIVGVNLPFTVALALKYVSVTREAGVKEANKPNLVPFRSSAEEISVPPVTTLPPAPT